MSHYVPLLLIAVLGAVGFTRAQPIIVAPDDPRLGYSGSYDRREPSAPRFAWPATQLRVRFSGAWLRVNLTDRAAQDETPENDWLAVEIDGKAKRPIRLKEGRHTYWVAVHLTPGVHTLSLTKRTEAEVGTITLHGIELAPKGQLLTTPAPEGRQRRQRRQLRQLRQLRMAVIGDSISAGYGIEGKRGSCRARASNQDASRSYASVAARELMAELVVSAWSGKGVLRNYEARDQETMPALWERSIPTEADSPLATPALGADVVVVHLGTNDLMGGIPEEVAFLEAYRQLLQRITALAPTATLMLVLSPLVTEHYPHPSARSTLARWLMVLKAEREARGQLTMLVEQALDPKEGLGCVGHPNVKSHARLGHELAQALRARLAW